MPWNGRVCNSAGLASMFRCTGDESTSSCGYSSKDCQPPNAGIQSFPTFQTKLPFVTVAPGM